MVGKYNANFLKDDISKWTWKDLSHTENQKHSMGKYYGLQNHSVAVIVKCETNLR